jgi:hypothetical protein
MMLIALKPLKSQTVDAFQLKKRVKLLISLKASASMNIAPIIYIPVITPTKFATLNTIFVCQNHVIPPQIALPLLECSASTINALLVGLLLLQISVKKQRFVLLRLAHAKRLAVTLSLFTTIPRPALRPNQYAYQSLRARK